MFGPFLYVFKYPGGMPAGFQLRPPKDDVHVAGVAERKLVRPLGSALKSRQDLSLGRSPPSLVIALHRSVKNYKDEIIIEF